MLIAATKHKLRLKKTGLIEDEVTSTIFGPIVDMPGGAAWNIIKGLSKASGISKELLSDSPVDKVEANFWPDFYKNVLDEYRIHVIPDVYFHFSFQDGTSCNVLLEVKWGQALGPRCELVRQWTTRPRSAEEWIHLYLATWEGRGKSERDNSIEILRKGCDEFSLKCYSPNEPKFVFPQLPNKEANIWKNRLGVIGWRHVQKLATEMTRNDYPEATKRWANGVKCFLEYHGYIPFIGFDWLQEEIMAPTSPDDDIFFHIKPWFGFLAIIEIICNESESIFFRGQVTQFSKD
ncbi:MAG: hypothetical protein NT140_05675 [Deltaproteobacteria bacterium]|nr:hypothetical protein [Deltaproteobacteria bacterium]